MVNSVGMDVILSFNSFPSALKRYTGLNKRRVMGYAS